MSCEIGYYGPGGVWRPMSSWSKRISVWCFRRGELHEVSRGKAMHALRLEQAGLPGPAKVGPEVPKQYWGRSLGIHVTDVRVPMRHHRRRLSTPSVQTSPTPPCSACSLPKNPTLQPEPENVVIEINSYEDSQNSQTTFRSHLRNNVIEINSSEDSQNSQMIFRSHLRNNESSKESHVLQENAEFLQKQAKNFQKVNKAVQNDTKLSQKVAEVSQKEHSSCQTVVTCVHRDADKENMTAEQVGKTVASHVASKTKNTASSRGTVEKPRGSDDSHEEDSESSFQSWDSEKLEISEQDLDVFRTYLAANRPEDLYRFDNDDQFQLQLLYQMQPLVKVPRNREVDRLLQAAKPDTIEEVPNMGQMKRTKPAGGRSCKGRGTQYTPLEDEAIVAWVNADDARPLMVNGNVLWKQLETSYTNITGHTRSWHSLRNRYLRHLLPSLRQRALPQATDRRPRHGRAKSELPRGLEDITRVSLRTASTRDTTIPPGRSRSPDRNARSTSRERSKGEGSEPTRLSPRRTKSPLKPEARTRSGRVSRRQEKSRSQSRTESSSDYESPRNRSSFTENLEISWFSCSSQRAHGICDEDHLPAELQHVKQVLRENKLPPPHTHHRNRVKPQTVERKPAILPYVKGVTDKIGNILRRASIKCYFKPSRKISQFLRPVKCNIPFQDAGVYKLDCECGLSYIGQTKRSVSTRVKEHIADMKHQRVTKSAVCEHALSKPNHFIMFDKIKVLSKETKLIPRMIREAIEIKKHPNFNREGGWNVPPVWDPVIHLTKPHTSRNIARRSDTVSTICVDRNVSSDDDEES